jgi:hypothetical protein
MKQVIAPFLTIGLWLGSRLIYFSCYSYSSCSLNQNSELFYQYSVAMNHKICRETQHVWLIYECLAACMKIIAKLKALIS